MTVGTLGTRFEIEGPSGVVEATSFVFTDLPEGENRFRARVHNDGGSSEWTDWVSVYHDYSPPTTTAHFVGLVGMNDWYISTVSTSFNMTDSGCFGVSVTTYTLNGTPNTYTGSPFNILNDGFNTLAFSSTDGHHPENEQSATIQIDTLAPTVSISPDRPFDVSSGWWTAPLTVTIHADDTTSGISSLEYNLNQGGWVSGNSITLSTDGIFELDVQATDNAGYLTYDGAVIAIDSTAPILDMQITGEQGENSWFITPPTVTLSATDATSGVIGVLYQLENETQAIYTTPLTFVREGLYTLHAFAVDEAQHITTRTVQIGYDITPPQTTITLTETENGMTITLNRWDGVSGFALTRMAINGVWTDYHAPVTVTDTGEYWVQFYTIDFAGNIEAEKIASFTIEQTGVVVTQVPPVVNIIPPANPPTTPPFETRDDFPPDLHDENVYFQLPPMVIPPFETGDDFLPNLHDEGVYYTYPEDNRVPDGAGLPIQTALTGDNAGDGRADTGIKRNPHPIVDMSELPDNASAPVSIPTTTAPIPASNPLNGVLVTLATLGVITASAGALTMTSTAIAKKKEQDEAKAAQLAQLQAEQALQAETASANYAENQQKQAQATATVVMAGKQSQANKNFWYAYALWQQKVAQALARRRAEELARKRAEAEARARQAQSSSQSQTVNPVLALLAKLIPTAQKVVKLATIGVAVASLLLMAGSVVQDGAVGGVQMVNDVLNPPDNSSGLEFCGIMAIICPVGGAGGIAGESGGGGGGSWVEWVLLALATAIATVESSTDTQVLPYPQIGPMPRNFDDEYLDEIPLDRILRIPWADFMNPDLDEPDGCNSEEFAIWWYSLPPAPPGGGLPEDRAYEERIARGLGTMGTTQNVPVGLETINADGANPNNCFLIDAKHARNPENPSWRDDGFFPILNQVDDEIRRYYLAMSFNPQVWGLEIRTNSDIAKEYFESRLRHYGFLVGVNGIVVIYP